MSTQPFSLTAEPPVDWTRRFVLLFLAVLGFRVVFAAVFPLDFAGDEAYYWDWGRRLDWGYYSKPPMVAWLMAWASWVGQNSFFVIKLVPVTTTALGVWVLFLLTRRLYGARAAFWTGALILATPALAPLSILLTIDPPLFLFWGLSLYLAWRWMEGADGWWMSVSLAAALGAGYLSKPIQLLFPLLWVLFLGLSRADRHQLLRPRFYFVLLGSLLCLAPVVIWNRQHDWITFAHTAHHFEEPDFRLSKVIGRPLEFVGSQIALCSPLTWFLMAACVVVVVGHWGRMGRRERYLFCFSGPVLAAVYLMSFWQRVHPNWPLVFYEAALVLVGGWALTDVPLGERLQRWRRLFRPAVWTALGLTLLMYGATFVIGWTPWAGAKGDPTERLRGWRQLGREVGVVLQSLPDPERTMIIVPSRRQLVSQLAFYVPGQPRVYRLEDPARINSQYGIWGGPEGKTGWDALIVAEGEGAMELPTELVRSFDRIEPLPPIRVSLGRSGANRSVRVWHGRGFRRWPYPVAEARW